jgi:hypothetical protein
MIRMKRMIRMIAIKKDEFMFLLEFSISVIIINKLNFKIIYFLFKIFSKFIIFLLLTF